MNSLSLYLSLSLSLSVVVVVIQVPITNVIVTNVNVFLFINSRRNFNNRKKNTKSFCWKVKQTQKKRIYMYDDSSDKDTK